MIAGDFSRPVRLPLDGCTGPANGFEATNMRFGKLVGGGWVVLQMQVDRVTTSIRRCDFCNNPISVADLEHSRRDAHDCAFRYWFERSVATDVDIVGVTIDTVDQR